MTDVLLLDYNGVIVDDEPLHFAALRDTLAETGMRIDETRYYDELLGLDDRGALREAFRRAGRPLAQETLAALAERKARGYAERARAGVPLVPGVRTFTRDVPATTRIGVVSGALRREIVAGLAQAGIADRVGAIVSAEDVVATKPDPEGYRRALRALAGGDAARALVVEDSRPGLLAARALGAGCVILSTSPSAATPAGADQVWRSFEGHSPAELTPLFREVATHGRG